MANFLMRASDFLKGVREEMKQVTWPTWDELIGSTLVVFVGVTLLAGFISVCDFILSRAARFIMR